MHYKEPLLGQLSSINWEWCNVLYFEPSRNGTSTMETVCIKEDVYMEINCTIGYTYSRWFCSYN